MPLNANLNQNINRVPNRELSPQAFLEYCVKNGFQLGALDVLNRGTAKLTQELVNLLKDPNHQRLHPKTANALKPFVQAYELENNPPNRDSHPQAYLEYCIKKGLQKGALYVLSQGTAKLTHQLVSILKDPAHQQLHPKTALALKSYVQAFEDNEHEESRRGMVFDNPNNLSIPLGHGLFREAGLKEATIERLRLNQKNNPVIRKAFEVLADADKGFQSDIRYLTDFLYCRRNQDQITTRQVANMIQHDLNILDRNRRKFTTGQNPEAWCIDRLLEDSVLAEAKKMIEKYPCLLEGRLPKDLKKYKSREVSALKTALIYCSLARDSANFVMKEVRGAYRLKLSETQRRAVGDMHIVRGLDTQYLYAPVNGYVMQGDQNIMLPSGEKVMMADCSGYVTNVLRRLFGDDFPRELTWELTAFHDYKIRQREDLSISRQGPMVSSSGRRTTLNSKELANSNSWYRNNRSEYNYLDERLDVVANIGNVRPGDIIVWRNKCSYEGRGNGPVNGHTGVILEVDVARNKIVLMENTAGAVYGLGIKEVSIVNSGATTRFLRPRV